MANRIEQARADLVAAIDASAFLPEWRIHPRTPEQIVAPCVYVDVPALDIDEQGNGVRIIRLTFPVVIVVDGSDDRQIGGLDEGLAAIFDAIESVPYWAATEARAVTLDVGGPRLRAVIVSAIGQVMARTLCQPKMEG